MKFSPCSVFCNKNIICIVIIWPVVLADMMESMCSEVLKQSKRFKLRKLRLFSVKIVATGNGDRIPFYYPRYYPDKIKV